MAKKDLNLVGYYLEGRKTIVVLDASGDEHEATNPDELWVLMMNISSDPALPRCEHGEVEEEAFDRAAGDESGGGIYDFACDQAEEIVTEAAGPLIGRVAGNLIRNNGAGALNLLRRISRKDRE